MLLSSDVQRASASLRYFHLIISLYFLAYFLFFQKPMHRILCLRSNALHAWSHAPWPWLSGYPSLLFFLFLTFFILFFQTDSSVSEMVRCFFLFWLLCCCFQVYFLLTSFSLKNGYYLSIKNQFLSRWLMEVPRGMCLQSVQACTFWVALPEAIS